MFWKDFLYTCLSWLAAVELGKTEENRQIAVFWKVWGDKRTGNIVKHDVLGLGTVLWRQMCKLLCFEGKPGNHCKIMQTQSKNKGFGGFCGKQMKITAQNVVWAVFLGVVVVAI